MLASDGKVFTLEASKLPGGRGQGEPIRLMADIDESASIVAVWAYAAGVKRLIASSDGNGFVVGEDELLSSTRKGRAVLNVTAPATAALIVPAAGDHVAIIGQNRKLLVFPFAQLNEMARGKGTRLQRYKDGGLSDAKVFAIADGLTWRDSAGRTFTVASPSSRNGSATAPKPGACRRRAFRRPTGSRASSADLRAAGAFGRDRSFSIA